MPSHTYLRYSELEILKIKLPAYERKRCRAWTQEQIEHCQNYASAVLVDLLPQLLRQITAKELTSYVIGLSKIGKGLPDIGTLIAEVLLKYISLSQSPTDKVDLVFLALHYVSPGTKEDQEMAAKWSETVHTPGVNLHKVVRDAEHYLRETLPPIGPELAIHQAVAKARSELSFAEVKLKSIGSLFGQTSLRACGPQKPLLRDTSSESPPCDVIKIRDHIRTLRRL